MKMLKYKTNFKDDSEFVPWMFGIARNACALHLAQTPRDDPCRVTELEKSRAEPSRRTTTMHDERAGRARAPRAAATAAGATRGARAQPLRVQDVRGDRARARLLRVGAVKVRAHRAMKQTTDIYLDLAGEVPT